MKKTEDLTHINPYTTLGDESSTDKGLQISEEDILQIMSTGVKLLKK
jgi:hypothetical protein